jgi:signal transduction histidine kinase
MSERRFGLKLHQSVFARQLAIMLATAVTLLLMVGVFFALMVSTPDLITSIHRMVDEYTRVLSAAAPGPDEAQRLASRLDLQIRYEGPEGTWATAQDLPSVAEAQDEALRRRNPALQGRDLYVVQAPGGGTYLYSWEFRRRLHTAHLRLLGLLLFFVAAVVFTAHVFLFRSLRPLRWLHEGVARLGEGQLDVVVPSRTRDEFGALTEAFNRMVRRIAEMLRTRDQLLLDVSHELRSPLTRMKVALELLPEGDKRRRIAADVAEMEALITELLELERLRDGHGIRAERQDLVPLLQEAADLYRDRPPGVRVCVEAQSIPVAVDADRIRTVLRNLLENALKYSLPDSAAVELRAVQDGEGACVRVTDDGPGIPEADLPRVFEPFFRVDRSRSKKTGGYGLGLSICKRIAEAHGGSIAAHNAGPRGATFTLRLPGPA